MKKTVTIILTLLTLVIGATQSTPYVLTEFPIAILPADTSVWIKWTGDARESLALQGEVDSGTIYFSRTPGGSDIQNYEYQILPEDVDSFYNTTSISNGIPQRGTRFVPSEQSQMETGIYYMMVAYVVGTDTFYSNEIKFIVRSAESARLLAPTGDNITDVTPTFQWDAVQDVPYYHLIVTDEKVTAGDDNSLEGLSIIWQAITADGQITYGAPDPSGTLTASPPPLSPGVEYSWFVLNNYGNNPAMTAVEIKLPQSFSLEGDTMVTPLLIPTVDTLFSSDYQDLPVTLKWTNLDTSANTYKVYLYAGSQDSTLTAQIAVWDGEVTAGSFGESDTGSIELNAQNILTTNDYSWKVIAVDAKGYGQSSELSTFHYSAPTGGVLVRTFENIATPNGTTEQSVGLCEIQVEVLDGSMETPLLFYTDNNGYLYRDRPVGSYRLTSVKDGYQSATKTVTVQEGITDTVILYLERPDASIYGVVEDNLGIPVNIATVKVISTSGDTVITESDPSGNFVVNCGKGDWDVLVTKSGYQSPLPVRISVDNGESKDVGSALVLSTNNYTFSGVVSNADGDPVVAAKVTLKNNQGTTVGEVPSTNSSGQYSFSINSGTYTIGVTKTGFSSFSEEIQVIASTEKNLTLSAGAAQITGSIYGRTWSFDGASDVAAIREVSVFALNETGDTVASTVSDVWGTYTLGVPGNFSHYWLLYSATGYESDSSLTDQISSGVTYSPDTDTLDGYATMWGFVRMNGSSTAVGDVQVSLVDTLTGDVVQSTQSDISGDVAFYSIPEATYRVVAAGEGLYADTLSLHQFSGTPIISNVVTIRDGRVYSNDSLVQKFEVVVAEGSASVSWTVNFADINTPIPNVNADVNVITPLVTKIGVGDSLKDIGLGEYQIEINAEETRILDCSKRIVNIIENDVTQLDTVSLPFYHNASDSALLSGTTLNLAVNIDSDLFVGKSITSAIIGYRDIDASSFVLDTAITIGTTKIEYTISPDKTGSYIEYYFQIVLDNGDVYGSSKELSRSYVKPDKSMITRLELVPVANTLGYTIPLNGSLRLELRGYYGDNFLPLDIFDSGDVQWAATGSVTAVGASESSYAIITGRSATNSASVIGTLRLAESGYTLAEGVDSVITRTVNVTDAELTTIDVVRSSSHPNTGYITNGETALFSANAIDSKGNSVLVSPQWLIYPDSAGTVSVSGEYTPNENFAGRVQIVASVNDTIRDEYFDELENEGMLVGCAVYESIDSTVVNDGFELTLTFPDSSVSGTPINVTVEHPQFDNSVYKTIPLDGISLISRIFTISRKSATKFRSDSVTINEGESMVSRASLIEARIRIPEQYEQFIDETGSHFTIGVWDDDSISWIHEWKPSVESRAAGDLLPNVLPTVDYHHEDSSFTVSIGDTLNSAAEIRLAILFNEEGDIQGDLTISPNPFSPYISPMNDYIFLPGMNASVKGTCLKITPMSSTNANNPTVTVNIYTANRTLVWNAKLPNTIPGKDYYLFWDGRTRRGTSSGNDVIVVAENTPIQPSGNEMCRNGRYFAVVTFDDGETVKRFTREIILFK